MAERELPAAQRSAALSLDRRRFLQAAGALAALGLLPTGCRPLPAQLAPPQGLRLGVLTPRSYATFGAASARLVGPEGGRLIGLGGIEPARTLERWLQRLPETAPLVQQALLLLEFGVFPLVGKLRPFTSLGGDAQDAVLAELMSSRFAWKRAVFGGIRSFAFLTFYADPASRTLTGYPGPFGGAGATIADAMRYDSEPDSSAPETP
ncbi:MAG: twin-arginine translocation signal domain-containing protein [Myxococcota bacterium]